jgi:hypothetical protein
MTIERDRFNLKLIATGADKYRSISSANLITSDRLIVTDRLSDNFSLVKASHKHRMSEVGCRSPVRKICQLVQRTLCIEGASGFQPIFSGYHPSFQGIGGKFPYNK